MTITLFIVVWVLCGFFAYGLTLAAFQRSFPTLADQDRNIDRYRAWTAAFFGPIGLVVSLIFSGHGWMWRLPSRHKP